MKEQIKDITDLRPAKGSTHRRKRVGRGPGCHGKCSGKGDKGQNARSGGGVRPGFEGGQMPLYRRLPKFKGMKNPNRVEFQVVNLADLGRFDKNTLVTLELLQEQGLIKSLGKPVKLLATGAVDRPLTIQVHKASKTAVAAIEAAGGKVQVI